MPPRDSAQVYVCLWSHAGGSPVHIHWVVQPVTRDLMRQHGTHGPRLQVAMFELSEQLPTDAVEVFSEQARLAFAGEAALGSVSSGPMRPPSSRQA